MILDVYALGPFKKKNPSLKKHSYFACVASTGHLISPFGFAKKQKHRAEKKGPKAE